MLAVSSTTPMPSPGRTSASTESALSSGFLRSMGIDASTGSFLWYTSRDDFSIKMRSLEDYDKFSSQPSARRRNASDCPVDLGVDTYSGRRGHASHHQSKG